MIQIVYLEGQWSFLPSLLELFEPARVRSVMPLHVTNIRNEQVRSINQFTRSNRSFIHLFNRLTRSIVHLFN